MAVAIRFWLFGLSVACLPAFAIFAQDVGGAGGLEIATVTGKFAAMQGNQIKVIAADKQEFIVNIGNQTNLRYQGKADPKFLMPGLLVRFSAQLTQVGIAEKPVAALEVFTLSQHRMSPEQQREQTPGVYQEGGELGAEPALAKNAPARLEAKKPEPKKPQPKKPEPRQQDTKKADKSAPNSTVVAQNYRVVGQLLGVQGNKLLVQAGQARVQFELDPQAVISVSSSDATFCLLDDDVKVSGLRTAGQDKFIQAETIQITGVKPLGPAEGKVAKNAKSSRASKLRGKGNDDKDDPSKPATGVKADAKKPDTKRPDALRPAPK